MSTAQVIYLRLLSAARRKFPPVREGVITSAANPGAMASTVEITLSGEERCELDRRAAKLTLPYRDVQRAKVVLYAAEGFVQRANRWPA